MWLVATLLDPASLDILANKTNINFIFYGL